MVVQPSKAKIHTPCFLSEIYSMTLHVPIQNITIGGQRWRAVVHSGRCRSMESKSKSLDPGLVLKHWSVAMVDFFSSSRVVPALLLVWLYAVT